jgi:hypothetical protein
MADLTKLMDELAAHLITHGIASAPRAEQLVAAHIHLNANDFHFRGNLVPGDSWEHASSKLRYLIKRTNIRKESRGGPGKDWINVSSEPLDQWLERIARNIHKRTQADYRPRLAWTIVRDYLKKPTKLQLERMLAPGWNFSLFEATAFSTDPAPSTIPETPYHWLRKAMELVPAFDSMAHEIVWEERHLGGRELFVITPDHEALRGDYSPARLGMTDLVRVAVPARPRIIDGRAEELRALGQVIADHKLVPRLQQFAPYEGPRPDRTGYLFPLFVEAAAAGLVPPIKK